MLIVIIVFDSVRAKAIVCLAGCTESEEDDLRTAIRDLVVLKTTNENGGNLPGSAMQPGIYRVTFAAQGRLQTSDSEV